MTLMLILRHDHVTLYVGTCLFGLFLSSITPTALSVAEMYIELSGRLLCFAMLHYVHIFIILLHLEFSV